MGIFNMYNHQERITIDRIFQTPTTSWIYFLSPFVCNLVQRVLKCVKNPLKQVQVTTNDASWRSFNLKIKPVYVSGRITAVVVLNLTRNLLQKIKCVCCWIQLEFNGTRHTILHTGPVVWIIYEIVLWGWCNGC